MATAKNPTSFMGGSVNGGWKKMIKHILSITGLIFVAVALVMSMTNYGKDVTDTYEKCSICLKEGVESVCDCQIVEVYGGTPELFWVFWGVGTAFTVIGFLYRQ